ncbi:hypothetical protein AMECASPLE_020440 [Ameca splendens]|uniref:Uncharacterized protein n=1 Tax=Ameca splendens TaxID=208324 RepID=A0ABV0Y3S8_9TELE
MNNKISGTMTCRQMRLNSGCVGMRHSNMFGHKQRFKSVQTCGGRVIIWAYFAATGPSQHVVIESTVNINPSKVSDSYSRVKCEVICPTKKHGPICVISKTIILNTAANLQQNG